MKLKAIIAMAISMLALGSVAHADVDIVIQYDGDALSFAEKPIIRNDKTLVQLRPIAEAMQLDIEYIAETGEVKLSDSETAVVFVTNSDIIKVNGKESVMISPAINYHDYTFVPIRDLAEPFGKIVTYDGETKIVTISSPNENAQAETGEAEKSEPAKEDENAVALFAPCDVPSGSGEYESSYFYQSQPELPFENNGRGFCWVCSYAMLISNITDSKVTPIDVANVNLENGLGANTTHHLKIMEKFGCEFTPALPEESQYFGGFNTLGKGETTIKFDDEMGAVAAIREALDMSPDGVLVRYDCYPHTMMAVGYDGDTIYFNDPGLKDAEHVPFEKTCLKNYKLSDITYMQAIRMIEGE